MIYINTKAKYHNSKTIIDGIKFDSKKEATRYKELKLLLKNGEIKELELQPRFTLQPKYRKNGKTIRKIEYVADFSYKDKKGKHIIEDVKGIKTEVYKLKKKIFEYKYPTLEIKEI